LERNRTNYTDLFAHIEPNGDERGRFNYHLRRLRSANLICLSEGQYRLTPRGEAALALINGIPDDEAEQVESITADRLDLAEEINPGYNIVETSTAEIGSMIADTHQSRPGIVARVRNGLRLRFARVKAMLSFATVLLLVGSVLLLASFFLPWFTVSSVSSEPNGLRNLPSGQYGVPEVLAFAPLAFSYSGTFTFFEGAFVANLAYVWLITVAVIGVTSTLVVRKFAWFGVSGTAVLALFAISMFVLASQLGPAFGNPSVDFAYGFGLAVIGSALIEAGARLKTPADTIAPLRTTRQIGIPLMGLGIASIVGGFFVLPEIPYVRPSSMPGIILMGLGFASIVGSLFAFVTPLKGPPSPGILLMVLGTISAVGGFFAFQYGVDYVFPNVYGVAMGFGAAMFVVGILLQVGKSFASRGARPAVS
jgi:hypothetical protein